MKQCRLCKSDRLTTFLDLGYTPAADDFLASGRLDLPETYFPLRVNRCDQCHFIQLDHVVEATVLYQNDYPYESSVTKAGQQHFHRFAKQIVEEFDYGPQHLAIDIGSNVGVLLQGFKAEGMRVLGIDPAENIANIAIKNGIETIVDFINPTVAEKVTSRFGRANVVTGSNVFAHIDDLDGLMTAVSTLLVDNGVLVIEVPYLGELLEKLEYDTIYHEHLSYISITPLVPFFKKHGFELFKVTTEDIHGGSIRLFVSRVGHHPVQASVQQFVENEKKAGYHDLEKLQEFARRVGEHRTELKWLLDSLKREGKKIAGVSAPAKGMTLLNYCKIGTETLEFLTEKSSLKISKYAPGSHIPIVPDQALLDHDIDYALLLAWNFKDEIIKNLSEFRAKGGKFIVPIPKPVIVE